MTETPDHLRITRSDRGFAFAPALPGHISGESVAVYESSLATEPCIWLRATMPRDRNRPNLDDLVEVTIELPLTVAQRFRDQLDWMITNHYQA